MKRGSHLQLTCFLSLNCYRSWSPHLLTACYSSSLTFLEAVCNLGSLLAISTTGTNSLDCKLGIKVLLYAIIDLHNYRAKEIIFLSPLYCCFVFFFASHASHETRFVPLLLFHSDHLLLLITVSCLLDIQTAKGISSNRVLYIYTLLVWDLQLYNQNSY